MITALLNYGQHQQYRIVVECNGTSQPLALAGFCAEEKTENVLFRHLQNLCLSSDKSLNRTHALICKMVQQWQSTLSIPASQTLNHIAVMYVDETIRSVCLYKTTSGESEKLINRISL